MMIKFELQVYVKHGNINFIANWYPKQFHLVNTWMNDEDDDDECKWTKYMWFALDARTLLQRNLEAPNSTFYQI